MGGVKTSQRIGWASSPEEANCLLAFFITLHRQDQEAKGQTLMCIDHVVELSEKGVTEKDVGDETNRLVETPQGLAGSTQ